MRSRVKQGEREREKITKIKQAPSIIPHASELTRLIGSTVSLNPANFIFMSFLKIAPKIKYSVTMGKGRMKQGLKEVWDRKEG